MSSGYSLPIFISSPVYNLQDLRAELALHLNEIGYNPILSSADGFPDSSPHLEPWESCLPVLEKAFVMVLILDGRYGQPLRWKNISIPTYNTRKREKVSPTHAEYLYARSQGKRMMVFVRNELMYYYQVYRNATRNTDNRKEAKDLLGKTLPDHIEFEALEFLSEVKTIKPIPWISTFEDVTTVKKALQIKLVNDLAETFMHKEGELEMVIKKFEEVMDGFSPEKRDKILEKINVTKNIPELKTKLKKLEQDLATQTNKDSETIEKLNKRITALKSAISEQEEPWFKQQGGRVKFNTGIFDMMPSYRSNSNPFGDQPVICDGCGNEAESDLGQSYLDYQKINNCWSCGRNLCGKCWPQYGSLKLLHTTCLDCDKKGVGLKPFKN